MVLLAESDAASLREALALLGDWEDELDELFAPTKSPTSLSGQQQTASPDDKRRRRSDAATPTEYTLRRDARKATLAQLQTQANDLQRLLENELARRADLRVNASAVQQECEAMAVRQKHQRVAAEGENAALRERVLKQRAIARRIVKLTRKAAAIAERLGHAPRPLPPTYHGPVFPIPQHIRYLDCLLDEARGILSSGAFKENGGDFQRVSFRDLGFEGLQSEFAVSWVVPFGADAVTAVLWSLLSGSYHRGRTTDHQLTHSAPDLVVTNFVSAPHPSGQPSCNHGQGIAGTSHGQTALRRYNGGDDSDRDGSQFLMMRVRGAVFDDAGTRKGDVNTDAWLQIEPLTITKATASTRQVSRIRWCTRVTGRPVDYDTTPPTARAKWVHSVVAGPMHTQWEENLMRNVQHIENALLRLCLRIQSPQTMEIPGEEPSLQEALRLVDDWDIDIAALFGLDDAPTPMVPPPLRPPPRKVRRATAERTELREELRQLQEHLASSSHVAPHAAGTFASEWREMAARQREQRFAVEVENRKLHEVVNSHLKFAHKTATLLKKVQQIDVALGSERAASIEKYRGPHEAILDSQLTRLNGLAVEARTVFSSGPRCARKFATSPFTISVAKDC